MRQKLFSVGIAAFFKKDRAKTAFCTKRIDIVCAESLLLLLNGFPVELFGLRKMGLLLQDCSQEPLRDERFAMAWSKHAVLKSNCFFDQLPRRIVQSKPLVDSAHRNHQSRLEVRLRREIDIDPTSTAIENFARCDFVAAGLIGICHLEGAHEEVGDAFGSLGLAVCAIALARNANRSDNQGCDQRTCSHSYCKRCGYDDAVPTNEFAGTISQGRSNRQDRLIAEISLDVSREIGRRTITPGRVLFEGLQNDGIQVAL